jgi:hypothetical protein
MEKKYPKKHNLSDYEIFSTLGIGTKLLIQAHLAK